MAIARSRLRFRRKAQSASAMDYRWGITRVLLKDIFGGLALVNDEEEDAEHAPA